MTVGVLKTSFASEKVWAHPDQRDHHFSVRYRNMYKFKVQGEVEGLQTERKGSVETTKLREGLCEGSRGRWSIRGGERLISTKG